MTTYTGDDETLVQNCGYNSGRDVGNLADEQPGGCTARGLPLRRDHPAGGSLLDPTPDDAETTSTLADLEGDVTNAENNGGGWLAFSFHQICDTTTSGCDPVYSWSPENFQAFVTWLASSRPRAQGRDRPAGDRRHRAAPGDDLPDGSRGRGRHQRPPPTRT